MSSIFALNVPTIEPIFRYIIDLIEENRGSSMMPFLHFLIPSSLCTALHNSPFSTPLFPHIFV